MENPFELIISRLDKIEILLEQILNKKDLQLGKDSRVEIMTVEDVANYLGYTKHHIYKLTMNNEIPHSKPGKRLLFIKKDIDDWIMQYKRKTRDEIEIEAMNYINSSRFKR